MMDTAMKDAQRIELRPARVAAILGAVVFGLVVLHLALQYHRLFVDSGALSYIFADKFNLDAERTIPAYVSSLLLLGPAALLGSIASDQERRRDRWYWGILAMLFLLLSVEEAVDFHNAFSGSVESRVGETESWLRSAWVIPAVAFVLVFALSYLAFFLRLPRHSQVLFALSGVIYVGGAIGGEIVGGWYITEHGAEDYTYVLISTAEEAAEMAGMVLFLYALLLHKSRYGCSVQVRFGEPSKVASVA